MSKAPAKLLIVVLLISVIMLGTACAAKTDSPNLSDQDNTPLKVVASFYPMYDFTAKIGQERIEVINLVPAGAEPHSWEPSASEIIHLETAALFVYNGAGMEMWVDSVLAGIENKDLVVVETAGELASRQNHEHESHEHETHGHGVHEQDPHVWLSPLLAIEQMRLIKDGLIAVDPQGRQYYEDNFAAAKESFIELHEEFAQRLEHLEERDLVVAHEAYGYLADAYNLNQVAISGLSPEDEPSPGKMAQIIDYAADRQIKVIFFESLASPKVAETIAAAIGARTEVLSTLEGLTEEELAQGEDYLSVMRTNLETIEANLK